MEYSQRYDEWKEEDELVLLNKEEENGKSVPIGLYCLYHPVMYISESRASANTIDYWIACVIK